ncbi:unnamed protein product [Peniophora sp. CBMAI 1063]|nr:unnamed protein product [Peniophora sp. CBMAI 1063]
MAALTVPCTQVDPEQRAGLKDMGKMEVDVIDFSRMKSPALEALYKLNGGGTRQSEVPIMSINAKRSTHSVVLPSTTTSIGLRASSIPSCSTLLEHVEGHDLSSDSSSDPDSESDWSDIDSDQDSSSDGEECDEADPWTKASRLNVTSSATPDNTPILPNEAHSTSPYTISAELLSTRLSHHTERHIICWTCGVTLKHDPGCRRKHVPSKVRVPLQPAREMAFPKPLPGIRECEFELPEPASLQFSQSSTFMCTQSASMTMLARIAAKDAQARESISVATTTTRMIATPVECAVKFNRYLWRGLTRPNTSLHDHTSRPGLFDIFPHITLVDAVAAQC